MLGVLDTSEAQKLAREAGLDLVEVNPKAHPPVCKIMDFGKFKYEEKKRQGDARKRQSSIELKEIKIRPKTDDHDLDFKIKHVRRFIEEGNKVKITCRFRGREITHPEPAQRQLEFIAESVNDVASIETPPRMEGRTMSLILTPGAGRGRGAAAPRGPVVVEQRVRPPAGAAASPAAPAPAPSAPRTPNE